MNSDRSKKRVVSMAVTIALVFSMIISAFAMVTYVPDVVTGTQVGNEQIDAAPPSTMIRLKNANFNTANGNPDLPSTLAITSYPDHIQGTYIVQKEGPITEEWKAEITKAGGEILSYIPDNAFLVRMENSAKNNVASVRGNQWMGIYQPAYKISPELNGRQGTVTVDISIFKNGNNGPAVRFLKDNAGVIKSVVNTEEVNYIRAEFDASILGQLASMPDVHWMNEFVQPKIVNDGTAIISQSGAGGSTRPIHAAGIQGQGQIACIGDSGLAEGLGAADVDHVNFNGAVYGTGSQSKVIHYYVPADADGALGDESGASFHGSHCAGTVLGDGGTFGTWDAATYDGHAFRSRLVFQDLGREDDPATPDTDEVEYIYSPSDLYNDYFLLAENEGAKVHSNSWGGGFGYMSDAAVADLYIWDSQDFTICFAAGNDGAAYTIGSQAESKNMITVGASSALGTSMASFSSRGPAVDGRIKPDITQCGESVMSVDGGGGYQSMQGTSMATPGTAGNALLVRQYFTEGWYPTGTKVAANGFTPSAALIKAALINGADDFTGTRPDFNEGWGQLDIGDSLYLAGDTKETFVYDNVQGMVTGDYMDFAIGVDTNAELSITLAYSDYPGDPTASKMLVNDLGLLVMGPGGVMWRGNNFANGVSRATTVSNVYDTTNNVEGVRLSAPQTGTYVIRVSGENVAIGPQNFALHVIGGLADGYGKVFMDRTVYDDADTIALTVEDTNNPAPTVDVTLTTSITGDSETITMGWTAVQSGIYTGGSINTGIGTTVVDDGILQVAQDDVITASYEDGDPAFIATTIAWADFKGPQISDVFVTGITGTTGVPTWVTDENSDSTVYYRVFGQSTWSTTSSATLMINHRVALKNLAENTKYEFYVESTDWRGRTSVDNHGGSYYTFRTTSAASGGALILLVDDDIGSVSDLDGSPFELDWKNNLDFYGWTYTHWDMNILGSPTTADLNQAPMIIWTVSEGYPQIGVDDRAALKGYLDQSVTSSGTVPMAYIVGQDIGWDMGTAGTDPDTVWLGNYLAATFNRDDADGGGGDEGGGRSPNRGINPFLVDDIGHALNDVYDYTAMNLEQDVYGDTRFWPDSVTPRTNIGGNMGVASWDYDTSKVTGDCAAIAQTNGGLAETARIQFEAFSHDMLDSTGAGGNWDPAGSPPTIDSLRAGVLDETIRWLLGGNHPTIDLSQPVGGETVTATTSYTISWTVSGASSIDVYCSANGGQEYVKLNAAPLAGTATSYSWSASSALPFTTAQDGTEYKIKVVALGTATYSTLSDYSESGTFTIDHNQDSTAPITTPGSVNVDMNPIAAGDAIELTANLDDSTTGMSNIQAAQWCRGATPSWPGTAMNAADGAFNEMSEDVIITIPGSETSGWATGTWHTLWVRGQDSSGNWATLGYQVEVFVAGTAAPTFAYDIPVSSSAGNGDWVFVSFPYVMSGNIVDVLNDATNGDGQTTWDIAKWYDPTSNNPWKTYSTIGAASLNDMPTFSHTMGVWLRLVTNGGDNFITTGFTGDYSGSAVVINLEAGWNLVGYPSDTNRQADVALSGTGADMIGVYQAAAPYVADVSALNTVTMIEGNAYWVHVTSATTWTVGV
jgi:hypothetical protein